MWIRVELAILILVLPSCSAKDCHLRNGKLVAPGCLGCEEDPQVISSCASNGQWEKERCPRNGKCVYGDDICKAKCVDSREVGTPSRLESNSTNLKIKRCPSNGTQSLDIGCSQCIDGYDQLISVCMTNGKFEQQKCLSGSKCVENSNHCGAVCAGGDNHHNSVAKLVIGSSSLVFPFVYVLFSYLIFA